MEERKINPQAEIPEAAAETEAAEIKTEEAAAAEKAKVYSAKQTEPVDETGIIAAHTKVIGDIVTRGHLVVYGEVEGNITAAGNVTATGRIQGDIVCSNLKLSGCQAKSNLTVKENVIMDEAAKVEGKIVCGLLSADGYIKGDIEAAAEVNVHSNASIVGGIRTRVISVDAGAQLQGSINVVK